MLNKFIRTSKIRNIYNSRKKADFCLYSTCEMCDSSCNPLCEGNRMTPQEQANVIERLLVQALMKRDRKIAKRNKNTG